MVIACNACIHKNEDNSCNLTKLQLSEYDLKTPDICSGGEPKTELKKDPISPNYYNDTKIAPIDVIDDWELDFCLGSALKYIKRAGKKDNNPSVQDLKKVLWYVEREIKQLKHEANNETF